jgi:[ribosomal protein S5]-alanine N-acetyltransferase
MSAIIETERLHLRPLATADSSAIFRMRSDGETMRFWDWPPAKDPRDVFETVAAQIDDMERGRSIYWAVCLDDQTIGCCDLSEIDPHHARAEAGYIFARSAWGQGYAGEAMKAVVGYAFGPLALARLYARMHARNEASRRLLTRLGFSYEGTLRGHVMRDGARRDCQIYGLLRGEMLPAR